MKKPNVLNIDSVKSCNDHLGLPTRNPMVDVIDLSRLEYMKHTHKYFSIYSISCYFHNHTDTQPSEDAIVATMSFYAPGQYGRENAGISRHPKGWILLFDEKVAHNTVYENRIRDFPFFSSTVHNTIDLTQKEMDMVINCMHSIDIELNNDIDDHSSRILISGIAVLLSLSMRYYDKHNTPNNRGCHNIMVRLNNILDEYLRKPSSEERGGVPTVASVASRLGLSPNYLGDFVRKHTGYSAHNYIRGFIMREAKRLLLYNKLSINAIAYHLGYKYPHHFTRIFKQEYGMTPNEYRAKHHTSLNKNYDYQRHEHDAD